MTTDSESPKEVTFTDEYSLAQTRTRTPCLLDSAEWEELLQLIEKVRVPNPVWENFGCGFIGIAISCGISFYVSYTKTPPAAEWGWLTFAGITLVIGLIALGIGIAQRKDVQLSITSVTQFTSFLKKSVNIGKSKPE